MEALITTVQKFTVVALAVMLIVVMTRSAVHLGLLIGQRFSENPGT
jgi:hypothetical protein